MRWAALSRRPPILRGVSASHIRADHAVNQARIGIVKRRSRHQPQLTRSRLLVTYRISVSALAIMHSPRSADFRWPRSRRRQPTPPHSPTSNRLKQETARPPQFPQDDPSSPAGSRTRTSPSSPCRFAGNPVCRSAPGSARSPGYSCPSVR
jgi:hypothetical protein